MINKSEPHQCPVCSGTGLKEGNFYKYLLEKTTSASLDIVPCRSCEGSGVIWSSLIVENKKILTSN